MSTKPFFGFMLVAFILGMCVGAAIGVTITERREARKRHLQDCMSAGHQEGWCEAYLDGYFENRIELDYSQP